MEGEEAVPGEQIRGGSDVPRRIHGQIHSEGELASRVGGRVRLLPGDARRRPHPRLRDHGDRAEGVALGDAGGQARFALGKIRAAVEALGGSLGDVVRTRIHVAPGADWEAVARVHGEVRPACTLTFATLIGDEYLVEIEAEAVVGATEIGDS